MFVKINDIPSASKYTVVPTFYTLNEFLFFFKKTSKNGSKVGRESVRGKISHISHFLNEPSSFTYSEMIHRILHHIFFMKCY